MRDLVIKPAMNGYTVQAGCRTLVFETDKAMLTALEAYLKDPKKVETEYLKNERHREDQVALQPNQISGSIVYDANQGFAIGNSQTTQPNR